MCVGANWYRRGRDVAGPKPQVRHVDEETRSIPRIDYVREVHDSREVLEVDNCKKVEDVQDETNDARSSLKTKKPGESVK